MALNKKLTAGPKPVAYYEHYWHRLEWKRIEPKGKSYENLEYWEAWYRGQHRADLFQGKCGKWYGVLFGRFTMWRQKKDQVLHTLTACIVGPQH